MSEQLPSVHELSTFEDILDAIEAVTRQHGLAWRLSLGRLLLEAFFAGDVHAYGDRNPSKEHRFEQFFAERAVDLERYGIGVYAARECIRAWAVYRALPAPLQAALFYSHLVLLGRIADGASRERLAREAIQHDWPVRRLKSAVEALRGGRTLDEVLGDEEPTEPLDVATEQPGRLVSRAEKWVADFDAWQASWQRSRPARLRRAHRDRLLAAAEALRERAAALRALAGEER